MELENFFEQIFQPQFPLQELVKLHGDLTQFENYLQISCGGYYKVKEEIEMIYRVQELIEEMVDDEKERVKEAKKEAELDKLDLDF